MLVFSVSLLQVYVYLMEFVVTVFNYLVLYFVFTMSFLFYSCFNVKHCYFVFEKLYIYKVVTTNTSSS